MSTVANQYRASFIVLVIAIVAGIVLQFVAGGFLFQSLAFPVNAIVLGLIVLAVAGLSLYREKATFRLLSGVPFSVVVIAVFTIYCIVMGLIPQQGHFHSWASLLTAITSSWPFIFIYVALLLSLGCVTIKVVMQSGLRRWRFLFNHLGLWLILVGAGFGYSDYQELHLQIDKGQTIESKVPVKMNTPVLPFDIRLDEFHMEVYPPKWGVVDMRTRKFQPESKPVFYKTEQEAFASGMEDGMHMMVASTVPQPSYFGSDITVLTASGQQHQATVEVNKPHQVEGWAIYQSGYDTVAGKDSSFSVLQFVRDPWLPVVYAGIILMALGALLLIVTKPKKRVNDGMA